MSAHTVKLAPDVLAILERSTIVGSILTLPEQLARDVYVRVDKALKAAGGKWNRKAGGHMFPFDPRQLMATAVEAGHVVDEKKTMNFFPTPPDVADRMARLANIQPGMRALEPSAGTGNLLTAISQGWDAGRNIVAVEIDQTMAGAIAKTGVRTICADFLTLGADELGGLFDRIVMNPPFERGSDIKHILHALRLLKPDGRLVAICGNGSRQQERLKPLAASWAELPSGTFADTKVTAALLVIHKEAAA